MAMIFSTSVDPLKSTVTVRRKFVYFHQNDDIVHFRSFKSFTRLSYVSKVNDFLPFNFDLGEKYS